MNRYIKKIAKLAMVYMPSPVQKKIESIRERQEIAQGLERQKRTHVTKDQVVAALDNFDLGQSDVFLHTSLLNIGKVEGAAKFVTQEILRRLDLEKHTLLVSALPYRGSFYRLLKENPDYVFDVRTAPVAMGAVNQRLAKEPGARRSVHPTHSVIAIGKDAQWYTGEHQQDATPFGEHSPYRKFLDRKGKILLFGATLNNITAVHALEDMLGSDFPHEVYTHPFAVRCIGADGVEIQVTTPTHHPVKSINRDIERMRPYLEKRGAIECLPLGESAVMLVDAQGFMQAFCDMLKDGKNIYGKHKVTNRLLARLEKIQRAQR